MGSGSPSSKRDINIWAINAKKDSTSPALLATDAISCWWRGPRNVRWLRPHRPSEKPPGPSPLVVLVSALRLPNAPCPAVQAPRTLASSLRHDKNPSAHSYQSRWSSTTEARRRKETGLAA